MSVDPWSLCITLSARIPDETLSLIDSELDDFFTDVAWNTFSASRESEVFYTFGSKGDATRLDLEELIKVLVWTCTNQFTYIEVTSKYKNVDHRRRIFTRRDFTMFQRHRYQLHDLSKLGPLDRSMRRWLPVFTLE